MKRLLILIICVLAAMVSALTASASSDTYKTFRVYKSDGNMEVFFYSSLDSITTTVNDDGLLQLFHTPDSVYEIAMAEIDSISFTPIPTIYKKGAINLDKDLREYIIGSEDLTLFLSSDTPAKQIPAKGDNIVTITCDDILPYGFVGKVEQIHTNSDTIKVECSQISLVDVFESLSIEEEISSESEEEENASRANIISPTTRKFVRPSVSYDIKFKQDSLEVGPKFIHNYTLNGGFDRINDETVVNIAFIITPMPFQSPQVYYSYTETSYNRLRFRGSLATEREWNKEIPIQQLNHIPIPGVPKVVELFENIGVYFNLSGEIGFNGSWTLPYNVVTHITIDNKAPAIIPPTLRIIPQTPVAEACIEGSGSFEVGLYGRIGSAAIDKDAASIDATVKLGVDLTASAQLGVAIPSIKATDTKFYDNLNNSDLNLNLTASGEVGAKLAGNREIIGKVTVGNIIFKNPLLSWNSVPKFNGLTLKPYGNQTTLRASANVDGNLLISQGVGLGLYDKEGKLVDSWWHPTKYRKPGDIDLITHDFSDLEGDDEYTVHPIVSLSALEMTANPSAKAKTAKPQCTVTSIVGMHPSDYYKGPAFNGTYELKFLDIEPDETIEISIMDSGNKKIFIVGYEDYGKITKESNAIQFSASTTSGYQFDHEDYSNWTATSRDKLLIKYRTSKDNYKSYKSLEVEYDLTYHEKPWFKITKVFAPPVSKIPFDYRYGVYPLPTGTIDWECSSYWVKKVNSISISAIGKISRSSYDYISFHSLWCMEHGEGRNMNFNDQTDILWKNGQITTILASYTNTAYFVCNHEEHEYGKDHDDFYFGYSNFNWTLRNPPH